jgi:hypothetical protein
MIHLVPYLEEFEPATDSESVSSVVCMSSRPPIHIERLRCLILRVPNRNADLLFLIPLELVQDLTTEVDMHAHGIERSLSRVWIASFVNRHYQRGPEHFVTCKFEDQR